MLTLDLNLASRPFKNDTLPWVGLGLAIVALTLLTIWNVRTYRQNSTWVADLKEQYSTTRAELEQFDRRERGAQREIEGYDLEALHVRADKANEVILWNAFSWTRLFNLLQEVLPDDVQMISIRPIFRPQGADKKRDDVLAGRVPVAVEGVAKTLRGFLAFERALLAHPNFDHVEPEGHTLSRTGSLAFELSFLYDPGVVSLPPPAPEPPAEEAETAAAEEDPAGDAFPDEAALDTANETGAVQPEMLPEAQPEAQPETQPETQPPAVAADGGTNTGAENEPKRPRPPNSRRRNSRRDAADDAKEDGR